MKIVLLLSLVMLGGILLAKHLSNEPPLRGLAQSSGSSVLASRARPSVSFEPAQDMRLLTSGWCSVSPGTRHSTGGDARVSMVLYENDKGTLITTLAEAEGEWQWEAAHHCPFPVLREMKESQNNETLHESLYVLEAARDPFRSVERVKGPGVPTEHAACMVYRAKLVMDFRNMQVIYEYHEPLGHGRERDISYDLPWLNDFEKRGREACHIMLHREKDLHSALHRLDTMDRSFSRGLRALDRRNAKTRRHVGRGKPPPPLRTIPELHISFRLPCVMTSQLHPTLGAQERVIAKGRLGGIHSRPKSRRPEAG